MLNTYEKIEEKKKLTESAPLSELDALIQTLNIMDFNAALSALNPDKLLEQSDPSIEWIELSMHAR